MLIVDRVKGTPNCSAARAAAISPSGYCMPVRPTGASATGMLTGWPAISAASERSLMSTATRWRSRIDLKSASLAR